MGSVVTIYLDLPRDGDSGDLLASPRGSGAREDADGTIVLDSPAARADGDPGAAGGGASTHAAAFSGRSSACARCRTLERDVARERSRAREAEDAAAAAELQRADHEELNERLERMQYDLAAAKNEAKNAALEGRLAKQKAKKAQEELCERQNEFQRLQARLQAMEQQRRLERDIAEGKVTGEDELLVRFRREDPSHAVETLCRSLAGKNRQLSQQQEEYLKLARLLKQRDKSLAFAEARAAAVATVQDHPGSSGPSGITVNKDRGEGTTEGPKTLGSSERGMARVGGRAGRGKGAWGCDEEDAWEGQRRALGNGGPLSRAASARARSMPSAGPSLRSGPAGDSANNVARNDRSGAGGDGFGAQRSVSASSKASGKRQRETATSGEDLLDDILRGIAPEERATGTGSHQSQRPAWTKTSVMKMPSGAGSFARRDGSEVEAKEVCAVDSGTTGEGTFIIHGADGRGGRGTVFRPPTGGPSVETSSSARGLDAKRGGGGEAPSKGSISALFASKLSDERRSTPGQKAEGGGASGTLSAHPVGVSGGLQMEHFFSRAPGGSGSSGEPLSPVVVD